MNVWVPFELAEPTPGGRSAGRGRRPGRADVPSGLAGAADPAGPADLAGPTGLGVCGQGQPSRPAGAGGEGKMAEDMRALLGVGALLRADVLEELAKLISCSADRLVAVHPMKYPNRAG